MRIEEFVAKPIESLIKAERYVNDGSPSGFSEVNTTSEHTRPKSPTEKFRLRKITFNKFKVKDLGASNQGYIDENCILVHPDIVESFPLLKNIGTEITEADYVVPTSSGRTVLSIDQNCFIKLAYPKCLGRLTRHMDSQIITSACLATNQLIKAVGTGKTNPAFSFLREDSGRIAYIPDNVFKDSDSIEFSPRETYELGMLTRELSPYPYQSEPEHLIPFFALFSLEYDPITKAPKEVQDEPLVIQLFRKQHKRIESFLTEDILFPLYNTYFDALLLGGIELEAHSQNMLISIDNHYKVKRIVCRDLESAGRDAGLMDHMGIPYNEDIKYKLNKPTEVVGCDRYSKYTTTHSFMFDFKLGEYLVTPLLDKVEKYVKLERVSVETSIRNFNKKYINQLPSDFFPPEWCHYANVNWEETNKKREYIWSSDPNYRWVE